MQAPTHLITGVLLEKTLEGVQPKPLKYLTVAFLGVISHGILDALANLTYHTPKAMFRDKFWLAYHSFLVLLTTSHIKQWRTYKFGMVFSVLPDLDWVIIHAASVLKLQVSSWREPALHKLLFNFLGLFSAFRSLQSLPNWRQRRITVFLELALLAPLSIMAHSITKRRGSNL